MTKDFDYFAYNNDDFLISVAAGNYGPDISTITSNAAGKNIFSVGASESSGRSLPPSTNGPDHVAYFSSRGPTKDSRMKPDVIAPGHSVLSSGARPSQLGECEGPDNSFPNAPYHSFHGVVQSSGTCEYLSFV